MPAERRLKDQRVANGTRDPPRALFTSVARGRETPPHLRRLPVYGLAVAESAFKPGGFKDESPRF